MNAVPTLVLVPGAGCTERLWQPQIEALRDLSAPVVLDVKRHEHVADLARDALQVLPPRFALAGLSMGGFVALEIVRQAPERVLKLALLDTQARPETFAARARRPLAIFLLNRTGAVDAVFSFLWRKLVAVHRLGDKDLKAVVRQMARDTEADGLANQQKVFLSVRDYRPLLETIRVPTLIVVGEGDTLTLPERAEEMARLVPAARLVRIPDCGHLSTLEAPEAVSQVMRAWLLTGEGNTKLPARTREPIWLAS